MESIANDFYVLRAKSQTLYRALDKSREQMRANFVSIRYSIFHNFTRFAQIPPSVSQSQHLTYNSKYISIPYNTNALNKTKRILRNEHKRRSLAQQEQIKMRFLKSVISRRDLTAHVQCKCQMKMRWQPSIMAARGIFLLNWSIVRKAVRLDGLGLLES